MTKTRSKKHKRKLTKKQYGGKNWKDVKSIMDFIKYLLSLIGINLTKKQEKDLTEDINNASQDQVNGIVSNIEKFVSTSNTHTDENLINLEKNLVLEEKPIEQNSKPKLLMESTSEKSNKLIQSVIVDLQNKNESPNGYVIPKYVPKPLPEDVLDTNTISWLNNIFIKWNKNKADNFWFSFLNEEKVLENEYIGVIHNITLKTILPNNLVVIEFGVTYQKAFFATSFGMLLTESEVTRLEETEDDKLSEKLLMKTKDVTIEDIQRLRGDSIEWLNKIQQTWEHEKNKPNTLFRFGYRDHDRIRKELLFNKIKKIVINKINDDNTVDIFIDGLANVSGYDVLPQYASIQVHRKNLHNVTYGDLARIDY